MNIFGLIVILFAMSAITSSTFQNVHEEAIIARTANLGAFINIEAGVDIKDYVQVHSHSTIHAFTSIAENSIIGSFSNIGERCFIANDVIINSYVNIGNQNVIGGNSVIMGFAATGFDVKIGNGVKISQYSKIAPQSEIRDGCILAQYASIGQNCHVHPNTYIGEFTQIGPNSIVNERAVIHKFVQLPAETNVKRMAVIIRQPTSYDLYLRSEPVERIANAQLEIATRQSATFISPEFNNLLRELIDAQFNSLRTNCEQGIAQIVFKYSPSIKSLYLIRFHGFDRFKQYSQQIKASTNIAAGSEQIINNGIVIAQSSGQTFINGIRVDNFGPISLADQLQKEFHFDRNSEFNILEPDVVRKFIQLLALEQDASRTSRAEGDAFCTMVSLIQSGEREVTSAAPIGETISSTSYY